MTDETYRQTIVCGGTWTDSGPKTRLISYIQSTVEKNINENICFFFNNYITNIMVLKSVLYVTMAVVVWYANKEITVIHIAFD